MSKRKAALEPEFVVFWRGVQVWRVRAPDIAEAMKIAVHVTGRQEQDLRVRAKEEGK